MLLSNSVQLTERLHFRVYITSGIAPTQTFWKSSWLFWKRAREMDLSRNLAMDDKGSSVIVVTTTMTAVTTVAILLKSYGCLSVLRRRFGFEEWICLANLVSSHHHTPKLSPSHF